MRKIIVRTEVVVVDAATSEKDQFPVEFSWEHEYTGTGDNPRFYGGQLQLGVYESARKVIDFLQPITDLGGLQPAKRLWQ